MPETSERENRFWVPVVFSVSGLFSVSAEVLRLRSLNYYVVTEVQ